MFKLVLSSIYAHRVTFPRLAVKYASSSGNGSPSSGGGATGVGGAKLRDSDIPYDTVRLISEEGKMLGTLSLQRALGMYDKSTHSLVVMDTTTDPPVARIMSRKQLYESQKHQRQQRKQAVVNSVKELTLSPGISSHDLEYKTKRVKDWLEKGHQVMVVLSPTPGSFSTPASVKRQREKELLTSIEQLLREKHEMTLARLEASSSSNNTFWIKLPKSPDK